jgi:hypothetical protein
MSRTPEFEVTLSPALLTHLAAESRRLDVPLEWLVASMVLDTIHPEAPSTRATRDAA